MKLIFTAIFISLTVFASGQLMQATLKNGTEANKVIIALKSDATFTSQPTNLQFTVAVPTSVGARPVMTIESNNYSSYFNASGITTIQTATYLSDYVYLINMAIATFQDKTYTAGVEDNVVEISFSGSVNNATDIRLVQLPGGMATTGAGSENGNYNYYVEYLGSDRTHPTNQFYASPGGTAVNTPLGFNGYAYVSRGADPMPVNWLNFTAKRSNQDAVLNWQVANQINNDHFQVEVSKGTSDFIVVDKVAANSNNSYQYVHQNIDRWNATALYYRIKQVDKDGKFTYSEVRKLQLNSKALLLTLSENPVKGDGVKAFIHASEKGRGNLVVTDMSGKIVFQKLTNWSAGTSTHHIDLGGQASGGYILSLVSDSERIQVKFVK